MMPDWWAVALMALATGRIASILSDEHGPFDLFLHLRQQGGEHWDNGVRTASTWWGKGLVCFWCVSTWVGFFFLALYLLRSLKGLENLWWWVSLPFTLSALAIAWERLVSGE